MPLSAVLLIVFLMFRPGGLLQIGKLQIDMIRERPMFGSAVAFGILAVNLGVAYAFLRLG